MTSDFLQLIGGAVTKEFRAGIFVAGFVLLLGLLPWQEVLGRFVDLPPVVTEWWFSTAMVLTSYAIVFGAAVWNRSKVKKDDGVRLD